MKRILCILSLLVWALAASAQTTKIPQMLELAQIEVNDGEVALTVFNMPEDGQNHYFLSVGHLGVGNEIIQVQADPIFELFIPLGDTVAETLESLQRMQSLFKEPVGTSLETSGCLALGFPNDKLEPVTVTYRKFLLTRSLEFSIEREGYLRANHIPRSDFSSLVSGVKLYRKLHPKEQ